MHWPALHKDEIRRRVLDALRENKNYGGAPVLGVPGTYLDTKVFWNAPFLENAPYLKTMVANPNHIGCHTQGASESIFHGTHEIERDLLRLCAEQILGAAPGGYDGYVSSGGTESNLQALWGYRNELRTDHGLTRDQVLVAHSEDTHYSIAKACDILELHRLTLRVDANTREIDQGRAVAAINDRVHAGVRAVICVLNMGTTMFGSVDEPEPLLESIGGLDVALRVHVDAAFGGFLYPFTRPDQPLSFREPRIGSVTLDAHKMLGAPYGTGVFLARKGFLDYVRTSEAQYVPGLDNTVCGSRSGANAVAIWMILQSHGSEGSVENCTRLVETTSTLCLGLDQLGLRYFRDPHMNIVTVRSADLPSEVARRFHLVPDRHDGAPDWWKIVVMDHVDEALIRQFLDAAASSPAAKS